MLRWTCGALALALLGSGPALAQDQWKRWQSKDGVNVDYAVRDADDGFRVAWRCTNVTSRPLSCSVGAGENKEYTCYRGNVRVGRSGALGERATVGPGKTYTFPSEPACRGTDATYVQPFALISIED